MPVIVKAVDYSFGFSGATGGALGGAGGVGGALGGTGGALGGTGTPEAPATGTGGCSAAVWGVSSVPQSTHTVAMGLLIFPHLEHLFSCGVAGLKHILYSPKRYGFQ